MNMHSRACEHDAFWTDDTALIFTYGEAFFIKSSNGTKTVILICPYLIEGGDI